MPEEGHNKGPVPIGFDDLRLILDEVRGTKKPIDEANGKHRQKIKTIIEDQHWHPEGLAMIRKLDDKSDTGLIDVLHTFDMLYKLMMEHKWGAMMADLLSSPDDTKPAEDKGNVTKMAPKKAKNEPATKEAG